MVQNLNFAMGGGGTYHFQFVLGSDLSQEDGREWYL